MAANGAANFPVFNESKTNKFYIIYPTGCRYLVFLSPQNGNAG